MFDLFARVALAALFYAGAVVSAFTGFTLAALAALALFVLAVTPAAAAAIDLSPIVELAFSYGSEILVGLLIALFGYLAALLKRKTGIDLAIMQQGDNRMLHEGIRRGVNALERGARDVLVKDRSLTIDVESPVVAALANRMLTASPGLLKRMGIDEATLKLRILEHLTAKLNQAA